MADLDARCRAALRRLYRSIDRRFDAISQRCPVNELTPQQHAVLALVAKGYSNKLIAKELDIQPTSVKTHLTSIFRRLDVHNRTAAALRYLQGVDVKPHRVMNPAQRAIAERQVPA